MYALCFLFVISGTCTQWTWACTFQWNPPTINTVRYSTQFHKPMGVSSASSLIKPRENRGSDHKCYLNHKVRDTNDVHIYLSKNGKTYILICFDIYIYVYRHSHEKETSKCYIFINVFIYLLMYVCIYVDIDIYIYNLKTHIYIYNVITCDCVWHVNVVYHS